MSKKKIIILSTACAAIIGTCIVLWKVFASTTRIAFVNYQAITLGQIAKANDNSFVKLEELPADELAKASRYDMVFVNGMGIRITAEQRHALEEAAKTATRFLLLLLQTPTIILCR